MSVSRPLSLPQQHKPEDIGEGIFYDYINIEYTDPYVLSDIQYSFEQESEIQLYEFLRVSSCVCIVCHSHNNSSAHVWQGLYLAFLLLN